MDKENSDAKELAEAKHEMSCCDDIALDRPLADCISQLQAHREYLETRCGEMRKALRDAQGMIAFLCCCIHSGESLSAEDERTVDNVIGAIRNALNGGPR